jgi:predicted PurR-regulated permease PerM
VNNHKSLIRNSSFVLGVVSQVVFMSGGLVSLLEIRGQLMFSFVWFFIAPIPFGIVFAFLVHSFLWMVKRKSRSNRDNAISLTILATILMVIVAYVVFLGMFAEASTLKIL